MNVRSSIVAFGALLALSACDSASDSSSASADASVAAPARDAILAAVDRDTYDGYLLSIAERTPGFAGFVDEGGQLRVAVAKSAPSASAVVSAALAAADAIAPTAEKQSLRASRTPVRALYAFNDVMAWRGALVATTPQIRLHDADERKGVVYVEVESAADADLVRRSATRLGVPSDAVEVAVAPRFTPQADIRSYGPYLEGGYSISNQGGACTLGFMAFRGSASGDIGGFVTNSHCTSPSFFIGSVTGAKFYQGDGSYGNASRYLGFELVDPPFTGSGGGPQGGVSTSGPPVGSGGRPYRYSDAAFIDFELTGNSTSTLFGQIAQTQSSGTFSNGSFNRVNAFRITSDAGTFEHAVGSTVHKVGRTSGWTSGPILRTCTTTPLASPNEGKDLLCQHVVSALSGEGDSGSPVFVPVGGGNARLQGILWGSRQLQGSTPEFVYSPFDGINRELRRAGLDGSLYTHNP